MSKAPADATLPIDSKLAARLAGPALPFAGSGGADVACHLLAAPEGATPIPVALGVFPWRLAGALRLTIIAKTTFSLAGDAAAPIAADPLSVRDVHHKNQPLAHVTTASDRVPWKTAVDVTMIGHAHAPGGNPVAEMRARFALLHGAAPVIDKAVRVIGDRAGKDAAPKPFVKMPVVYERAYGGVATPTNPIGSLADGDDQPNVLDPESPWRPACFGPIPAAWPLRHKRLGETPRRDLDAPVMVLPQGFPFAYFQSAPQDQQLPAIEPDAIVVLEGFHPERERIQVALPGARVVGAAYGLDVADPGAPAPLPFRLDTLHVDADKLTATLVWRAYVHLRDEAQLGRLLIVAGAGAAGREPAIPERRPEVGAAPAEPATLAVAPAPAASATHTLEIAGPVPTSAKLPFAAAGAPGATLDLAATVEVAPYAAPAEVAFVPAATDAAPTAPPSNRSAAPFFHDLTKLRAGDAVVPRAKDALPAEPAPEEQIGLERYAAISAALLEEGAVRSKVLADAQVDAALFRKAERHWKGALDRESRRGDRALRDRHDEAFVGAWEQRHPDKFGMAAYARVRRAEEKGRLSVELEDQGLDVALGMRLRRVWSRRVDADPQKRAEYDALIAELRKPTA